MRFIRISLYDFIAPGHAGSAARKSSSVSFARFATFSKRKAIKVSEHADLVERSASG